MDPVIRQCLLQLEFGTLQQHGGMTALPLFSEVAAGPDYLTLKAALETRALSVTEVNQGGSVPELKVVNTADIPVLLLDGEELAGAKQNRILNTSILLKEHSEMVIPVSCTEQGRWAYSSAEFADSGIVASPRIRSRKSSSVSASLAHSRRYSSDQGEIWDEVAQLSALSEVRSPTGAMRDVYRSKNEHLDQYLEAFGQVPQQRGVFVFVNGKVAGLDFVSQAEAYRSLHRKLINSYALDAILETHQVSDPPTEDKAKSFLADAAAAEEKRYESVGHGWDHRFEGRELVGSALVYLGHVIHLAFFRVSQSQRAGRMSGYRCRSGFRT